MFRRSVIFALIMIAAAQPSFLEFERQNITPLPPPVSLTGGTNVVRQNNIAWLFDPTGAFNIFPTGSFVTVSGVGSGFDAVNVPVIQVGVSKGLVYPNAGSDDFLNPKTFTVTYTTNDTIPLGAASVDGAGSMEITTAAAALFAAPPAITPITGALTMSAPQQFTRRTLWGYIFTKTWGSNLTGFSGLVCNMVLFRGFREQIVYPFSLYSNIPTIAGTNSTAFPRSAASFVSQSTTVPTEGTLPLYINRAMVGETSPTYLFPFPADVTWDLLRCDIISRFNVSQYRIYLAAASH